MVACSHVAAEVGGEQEADKKVCCAVDTTKDSTVAKISEALIKLKMCRYIRPKLCKLSQS